jgi:hypothetical protein
MRSQLKMFLHETIHFRTRSGTKVAELVQVWGIAEVLVAYTAGFTVLNIYHCFDKSSEDPTIFIIASENA